MLASTTLVLVTESFDSTVLKLPILVSGSGVIAVLLLLQWRGTPAAPWTAVHASFFLLILSGVVSLAGAVHLRDGLLGLIPPACFFLLFSVSAAAFRERADEGLLHGAIFFIAVVTSLVGCAQAFLTVPSQLFLTSGNQIVMSTLGNTSYYAGFLLLLIPVVLGIGLSGRNRPLVAPVCAGLVIVMLFLLLRTESRSAWLSLLVALPLFVLLVSRTSRARWLLAAGAVAALALAALLFPEIVLRRLDGLFDASGTSSFARRMYFYEGAWRAFLSSPVFGHGIGNFHLFLPKYRSHDYWLSKSEDLVPHAHDEYLEILSETGLLGFLAFFGLLAIFFWNARKALKTIAGPDRAILSGYVCALTAVLIDNLASMNLRTVPVAAAFWVVAGASMKHLRVPSLRVAADSVRIPAPARYALALAIAAALPYFLIHSVHRYRAEKSFMEALIFRSRGNGPAAAAKLVETLMAEPRHQEASLYLATNLIERNEPARGLALLDPLIENYPFTPKAHLLRALALFALADRQGARAEAAREIAIAAYPQAYYYAAYFARADEDSGEVRRSLFAQLAASARSGRSEYVLEGVSGLSDVCAGSARDSCLVTLQQVARTFAAQPEILRSAVRESMELGFFDEARRIGEGAVARGVLTHGECEAILNAPAEGG